MHTELCITFFPIILLPPETPPVNCLSCRYLWTRDFFLMHHSEFLHMTEGSKHAIFLIVGDFKGTFSCIFLMILGEAHYPVPSKFEGSEVTYSVAWFAMKSLSRRDSTCYYQKWMQCSLCIYKTATTHYLKNRISTQSNVCVACTDPILLVISLKGVISWSCSILMKCLTRLKWKTVKWNICLIIYHPVKQLRCSFLYRYYTQLFNVVFPFQKVIKQKWDDCHRQLCQSLYRNGRTGSSVWYFFKIGQKVLDITMKNWSLAKILIFICCFGGIKRKGSGVW